MAIANPALYAVVPKRRLSEVPAPKRTITEIKTEKLGEFKAKHAIDRADALLTKLEERAKAFAKQIAHLQKRKASALARAARVEDAVIAHMTVAGLDKADGFHVQFATRNAPPALDVVDETLVPREYFREKLVASVDKNAVKDALAAGIEIAGVRLTSKVTLLRK